MKNLLIGFLFIFLILGVGVSSYYLYKKNEVDSRITKLDGQISNALLLESDLFSNCMNGKEQSAQNITVCEENTSQQLSVLTRNAIAEKQQLESLSLVEVLQY